MLFAFQSIILIAVKVIERYVISLTSRFYARRARQVFMPESNVVLNVEPNFSLWSSLGSRTDKERRSETFHGSRDALEIVQRLPAVHVRMHSCRLLKDFKNIID